MTEDKADPWLVKDLHADLKSWGEPGGSDNICIIKSDGESPRLAVREVAREKTWRHNIC